MVRKFDADEFIKDHRERMSKILEQAKNGANAGQVIGRKYADKLLDVKKKRTGQA